MLRLACSVAKWVDAALEVISDEPKPFEKAFKTELIIFISKWNRSDEKRTKKGTSSKDKQKKETSVTKAWRQKVERYMSLVDGGYVGNSNKIVASRKRKFTRRPCSVGRRNQ